MNETKFISRIGLFLIVSKILLLVTVIVFSILGGYDESELSTTVAILLPMLSVYSGGFVRFITKNRNKKDLRVKHYNSEFKILVWFILLFFVLLLFAITFLYPFGIISNFGFFRNLLAITEAAFGGVAAYILGELLDS